MTEDLPRWRGTTNRAILGFVARTCDEGGPAFVAPEERVAVFDNDGINVRLLARLTANGFATYIAFGGGRDFMRPISQELYRIPRERVVASSSLGYTSSANGGTITHQPEADYLDDGPEKPIGIWSRVGRRPILAA